MISLRRVRDDRSSDMPESLQRGDEALDQN